MKITLLLITLIFALDSFASSASRRRRRERAAREARMTKACEEEKAKLVGQSFNCQEDSETLLRREHKSHLNRPKFNTCVYSNEGTIQERAEADLKNTQCLKEAQAKHPDLVKMLTEEYQQEQKTSLIIFTASIVGIMIFIMLLL